MPPPSSQEFTHTMCPRLFLPSLGYGCWGRGWGWVQMKARRSWRRCRQSWRKRMKRLVVVSLYYRSLRQIVQLVFLQSKPFHSKLKQKTPPWSHCPSLQCVLYLFFIYLFLWEWQPSSTNHSLSSVISPLPCRSWLLSNTSFNPWFICISAVKPRARSLYSESLSKEWKHNLYQGNRSDKLKK